MASTKRMAALAIGVASAKPLPYLSGAVNGARDFHRWAEGMGYDSRLLVDEEEPVTIPRLAEELEALVTAPPAGTHRLVIYFAGHGLIREAEEGLWLLSDWHAQMKAVAVEAMRRRLYRYRVNQIAIFADACRGVAPDIDMVELDGDAVLGRGPAEPSPNVAIDKFIAAQDGSETYMVPGASPSDDRCLFSGVLIEGLWGTKPEAFSRLLERKVTSSSLGTYLRSEVPIVAQRYSRTLNPIVSPSFPEDDNVYFGDGPETTPPDFPEWPAPETVAPKVERRRVAHPHEDAAEPGDGGALEGQLRAQARPTHFESGSGLAIDGDEVRAIWTPHDVTVEMDPNGPGWWRVRPANSQYLGKSAPLLIELASGNFGAVTALPNFIGSLVVKDGGVAGLIYREVYASEDVASATERAIGDLERGGLRADAATDMAVELRHGKHADPVRGVISAYLYDSIGDVESIHRMAFYYVQNHQPIPFDIALLGQLVGERRPDSGILVAEVPPVPKGEPRTDVERSVEWSYGATPSAEGEVGGFWPWFRQGWPFLEEPDPGTSGLVVRHLTSVAGNLRPTRFTTLDPAGGHRLADLLGLEPRR